jgi:PAS domain S-box-containing protein
MAIENAVLFERSDMRLQEQTRRLEALIQSMEDGLILCDLKGKVVYANRRISDLSALTPQQLSGIPIDTALTRIIAHAPDKKKARQEINLVLQKKDKQRKGEIALEIGGKIIYLRMEKFDVMDARETSIGHGLILEDVTVDREVDRMKSSLVSTVSHELRTPLAAIKGYASTLLAEDVQWDHASQREFLSVISDETDRLSNLVNDLLDLSRIEAGSLRLSLDECPIEDLIQKAAKGTHLHNGNRFEVEIEADLPPLYADATRLESILRNLIENSIKYAGAHALIRVTVQKEKENILFRISDNGPGIPADKAKQVFDSFYRLDNSFSRVTSGAGLGLAICQGLVHAHGGKIWVEPRQKGTCIAFNIPLDGMETSKPRKKARSAKT